MAIVLFFLLFIAGSGLRFTNILYAATISNSRMAYVFNWAAYWRNILRTAAYIAISGGLAWFSHLYFGASRFSRPDAAVPKYVAKYSNVFSDYIRQHFTGHGFVFATIAILAIVCIAHLYGKFRPALGNGVVGHLADAFASNVSDAVLRKLCGVCLVAWVGFSIAAGFTSNVNINPHHQFAWQIFAIDCCAFICAWQFFSFSDAAHSRVNFVQKIRPAWITPAGL
jgi:hypothetical protein